MAENKMLIGGFYGKAGSMVGQKWKNKTQVHSRVFSKSPPTELQTESVRSFECLNRVASAIAKKWWNWLGLSDKSMHRHNAVAKLLRDSVSQHFFNPGLFGRVFKSDWTAFVSEYSWNRETKTLTAGVETALDVGPGGNASWLALVISPTGEVFLCQVPPSRSWEFSFDVPLPVDVQPIVMTLAAVKDGKRTKYCGFSIKGQEPPIGPVVDGCYYTSLTAAAGWRYEDPETMATDSGNVRVFARYIQVDT